MNQLACWMRAGGKAQWMGQLTALLTGLHTRMLMTSLVVSFMALCISAANASTPPGSAPGDAALEARVQRISAELRCLVCQNQTIADSNADLAVDLRRQVRLMLQQGQSEQQVLDFMTQRYGDFVLYRPPVKSTTALLWFGPAALLVLGVAVLLITLRRRSRLSADRFEPDPSD